VCLNLCKIRLYKQNNNLKNFDRKRVEYKLAETRITLKIKEINFFMVYVITNSGSHSCNNKMQNFGFIRVMYLNYSLLFDNFFNLLYQKFLNSKQNFIYGRHSYFLIFHKLSNDPLRKLLL
jgi:hypothetical protein